jgi:hypothetical protein
LLKILELIAAEGFVVFKAEGVELQQFAEIVFKGGAS